MSNARDTAELAALASELAGRLERLTAHTEARLVHVERWRLLPAEERDASL